MRKRDKEPFIPPERRGTVRQEIISSLEEGRPMTAKDISAEVRIPEKEVFGHLEHIQKSLSQTGRQLRVKPAECLKCGYVFRKREKLKTPGRCPACHQEHIQELFFSIDES